MATLSIQGSFPAFPAPDEPVSAKERRPDHLFIHTVRFWSMVAIVLMHVVGRLAHFQPVPLLELVLLMQTFKFGTISFFLISGFLVGDRLPSSGPMSYLLRRAHRLLPAWVLWYGIEVLFTCQRDILRAGRGIFSPHLLLSTLRADSLSVLIGTPFWFVPNFLIALTCVVLLRRWLDDLRLGAALLAVNLFYGVNVYTGWLPSRHTEAVFGFVFYLWLGAWCALRKDRVLHWARAISGRWLAFWACIAAGGSLVETAILHAHPNADYMNTLRFGNQIYSILIVILLVRIRRHTWPVFVNVAQTTYGVYLIHPYGIKLVFVAAALILYAHGHVYGPVGLVLIWTVLGPAVYFVSLYITRLIASSPWLGWAAGAAPVAQSPKSVFVTSSGKA